MCGSADVKRSDQIRRVNVGNVHLDGLSMRMDSEGALLLSAGLPYSNVNGSPLRLLVFRSFWRKRVPVRVIGSPPQLHDIDMTKGSVIASEGGESHREYFN